MMGMAFSCQKILLQGMMLGLLVWGAHVKAEERSPSPPGAKVFFRDLHDGDEIAANSIIHFGIAGMTLSPARTQKEFTGHHHLLIDTPLPKLDEPIPNDFNHIHFGEGETEVELSLTPGDHTLQLLLADHDHIPHNPPVMSEVIHVHVSAATVKAALTPANPQAKVFFVDLVNGAKIPLKSTIKFGISGMSLAPAGTAIPNSGHHHLLIDVPLPPMDREISSDFNHIHLGRAQTSVEVELTPGKHTLQLLLADHDHVPHDPPIMSEKIEVYATAEAGLNKTEKTFGDDNSTSPPDAMVYFIYPHDGMRIHRTSTIRFGLSNMGVAPAGFNLPNTGHHHLFIDTDPPVSDVAIPSDPYHLHFGRGQTEIKLTLTPGVHTLQLVLADYQHIPFNPPVMSKRIKVIVGYPAHPNQKHRQKRKSGRPFKSISSALRL